MTSFSSVQDLLDHQGHIARVKGIRVGQFTNTRRFPRLHGSALR